MVGAFSSYSDSLFISFLLSHRRSRPLVDKESRIIAVLGGRPNDPEYLRLTEEAARQLESARAELKFRPDQSGGRHGAFSSVSAGISFGGGQQTRLNLLHPFTQLLISDRSQATSRSPPPPLSFFKDSSH
jgi:hypothetical protein